MQKSVPFQDISKMHTTQQSADTLVFATIAIWANFGHPTSCWWLKTRVSIDVHVKFGDSMLNSGRITIPIRSIAGDDKMVPFGETARNWCGRLPGCRTWTPWNVGLRPGGLRRQGSIPVSDEVLCLRRTGRNQRKQRQLTRNAKISNYYYCQFVVPALPWPLLPNRGEEMN